MSLLAPKEWPQKYKTAILAVLTRFLRVHDLQGPGRGRAPNLLENDPFPATQWREKTLSWPPELAKLVENRCFTLFSTVFGCFRANYGPPQRALEACLARDW